MSDNVGLETFWPWGIATGDFNNDGYEDVFYPQWYGVSIQVFSKSPDDE